MVPYVVQPGDYLLKIASRYGVHPDDIWNASDNAHLKKQGRDPMLLSPGDVIYLPEDKRKWLPVNVGQVNNFTATVTLVDVIVRFTTNGKPDAGVPYTIEGAPLPPGALTSDGVFKAKVPMQVAEFYVVFAKRRHLVRVGHLDPLQTRSGVIQRLTHLGYMSTWTPNEALAGALTRFQLVHKLAPSGLADGPTLDALKSAHGS